MDKHEWDIIRELVVPLTERLHGKFPKQFLQEQSADSLQEFQHTEKSSIKSLVANLNWSGYLDKYATLVSQYSLHDVFFQDFAVKLVKIMAKKQNNGDIFETMRKLTFGSPPEKYIQRTFTYAIGSRSDIEWNGDLIKCKASQEQKGLSLKGRWQSLKLYNWGAEDAPSTMDVLLKNTRDGVGGHAWRYGCELRVHEMDTQSAVDVFAKKYPGKRIAWLNMANAHYCGGSYHSPTGGGQEQATITASDAAVILGQVAEMVPDIGVRGILSKDYRVTYKDGFHIPPGGCYFSSTKFITSSPQTDCFMIGAAFCDLRHGFVSPYSERNDYFSMIGTVKSVESLRKRLYLDIIAVLLTAMNEKIDVLILGASGCGTFRHKPQSEAKLWEKAFIELKDICLRQKRAFPFIEVSFAILRDKGDATNLLEFRKVFEVDLEMA